MMKMMQTKYLEVYSLNTIIKAVKKNNKSVQNGLSWILENAQKQRNSEWKPSISDLWRLLSYLLPSSLVYKQNSYVRKTSMKE